MDPAKHIMQLYHTNQQELDKYFNDLYESRDISTLVNILQHISVIEYSEEDRNILCLAAKNIIMPRLQENKLIVFVAYQKLSKNDRAMNLQAIYNQLERLKFAPNLFAALLEQDASQSKNLAPSKEHIAMLLEQPTLNSIKCLYYLFESTSYAVNQEILSKQRNFLVNLMSQAYENTDFLQYILQIIKRIVPNTIAQSKETLDFCENLLRNLAQIEVLNQKQLEQVCLAIQILIELHKTKQSTITENIDQIFNTLNLYFTRFFKESEFNTIVINIVQFFKQIDVCDYKQNKFLLSGAIIPLVKLDLKDDYFKDLRSELFEYIQQITKHYYVISRQEQELDFFIEEISMFQDNINLLFFAAIQPLWRHEHCRVVLDQVNKIILEKFNPMIQQRNPQLFDYNDVIMFTVYLSNFVVYSTKEQFIQYAIGIQETIYLFIEFLSAFEQEFYNLFNNFINKMFICGYNDFSTVCNDMTTKLFQQISILVVQKSSAASNSITFANTMNLCKSLFKIQNNIYIEKEQLTREYLSFKSGDIQNRKIYTDYQKQEMQEMNKTYVIIESLKTVSNISSLVFNLIDKVKHSGETQYMALHELCLHMLTNAIVQLAEQRCKLDIFDVQIQQFCNIHILIEAIMPKLVKLYEHYTGQFSLYQDLMNNVLDIVGSLSQISCQENLNFYQVLEAFPIILYSILSSNGLISVPDTICFCHAVTLLSTLVPFSTEEDARIYYEFTVQYLNQQLPSQSRTALQYLLDQLILYRGQPTESVIKILVTAAQILQQSQPSSDGNDLLISTLALASALYNVDRQNRRNTDPTSELNSKVYDGMFNYVKNIQFETVFELDIILTFLESLIGFMGVDTQARTIVSKPIVNSVIKKCIGIVSGVLDDELCEVVLQGFMADYNKILQGQTIVAK
ncbi:Conserved_hypothetical protein [Hexamita inflata]|uniref:Uncharacterized protein n=1 Tax=Hexamita inflata TaxID=28002 RepID=A0AA86RD04_9EUKA|nr:Conserved hypothetical protein [Hexamita inflata]